MSEFKYVGSELDLFAGAQNWKAYWSRQIRPFLGDDILEVGAGIGSSTRYLGRGGRGRRLCLEPDPDLHGQLLRSFDETEPSQACEAVCGTLESLIGKQFDTIVYIEVLEHIENDREELNQAASHLLPGGHLIVLAPAHQRLFSASVLRSAPACLRSWTCRWTYRKAPGCASASPRVMSPKSMIQRVGPWSISLFTSRPTRNGLITAADRGSRSRIRARARSGIALRQPRRSWLESRNPIPLPIPDS